MPVIKISELDAITAPSVSNSDIMQIVTPSVANHKITIEQLKEVFGGNGSSTPVPNYNAKYDINKELHSQPEGENSNASAVTTKANIRPIEARLFYPEQFITTISGLSASADDAAIRTAINNYYTSHTRTPSNGDCVVVKKNFVTYVSKEKCELWFYNTNYNRAPMWEFETYYNSSGNLLTAEPIDWDTQAAGVSTVYFTDVSHQNGVNFVETHWFKYDLNQKFAYINTSQDYVTPEMFGAYGDGENANRSNSHDDTEAFNQAFSVCDTVYVSGNNFSSKVTSTSIQSKTYRIDGTILLSGSKTLNLGTNVRLIKNAPYNQNPIISIRGKYNTVQGVGLNSKIVATKGAPYGVIRIDNYNDSNFSTPKAQDVVASNSIVTSHNVVKNLKIEGNTGAYYYKCVNTKQITLTGDQSRDHEANIGVDTGTLWSINGAKVEIPGDVDEYYYMATTEEPTAGSTIQYKMSNDSRGIIIKWADQFEENTVITLDYCINTTAITLFGVDSTDKYNFDNEISNIEMFYCTNGVELIGSANYQKISDIHLKFCGDIPRWKTDNGTTMYLERAHSGAILFTNNNDSTDPRNNRGIPQENSISNVFHGASGGATTIYLDHTQYNQIYGIMSEVGNVRIRNPFSALSPEDYNGFGLGLYNTDDYAKYNYIQIADNNTKGCLITPNFRTQNCLIKTNSDFSSSKITGRIFTKSENGFYNYNRYITKPLSNNSETVVTFCQVGFNSGFSDSKPMVLSGRVHYFSNQLSQFYKNYANFTIRVAKNNNTISYTTEYLNDPHGILTAPELRGNTLLFGCKNYSAPADEGAYAILEISNEYTDYATSNSETVENLPEMISLNENPTTGIASFSQWTPTTTFSTSTISSETYEGGTTSHSVIRLTSASFPSPSFFNKILVNFTSNARSGAGVMGILEFVLFNGETYAVLNLETIVVRKASSNYCMEVSKDMLQPYLNNGYSISSIAILPYPVNLNPETAANLGNGSSLEVNFVQSVTGEASTTIIPNWYNGGVE